MFSDSSQRIRDRNKQALLRLKKSGTIHQFEPGVTTNSNLCLHDGNQHNPATLSIEKKALSLPSNPPEIISSLKSQKDLFISHYRPSLRKSKLRIEDGLIPSDSKPNHRSSRSPKSGRVSQLAGRVERLLIQDPLNTLANVKTDYRIPTSCDQSIDFTDNPYPGCSNSLLELNSSSKTTVYTGSSPWYRYCRPKAPLLLPTTTTATTTTTNSDDLFQPTHRDMVRSGTSSSSSLDSPHDLDLFKPLQNIPILGRSTNPTINSPDHSFRTTQLHNFETDIGQENINWDSEFTLPPPPPPPPPPSVQLDIENVHANSDFSDLDRSFSLPSPPLPLLSEPDTDENCPALDEILAKPLASIANILPFHGKYGHRCPKWSVDNPNQLLPSTRFPFQMDRSMNLSPNVPSPPPLIVERLPLPTDSESTSQPQLFGIAIPTTGGGPNVSVARPTVLKREAPDGAEYSATESPFLLEMKRKSTVDVDSNPTSTTKRLSDFDSSSRDYSPKKSRTHLLLPSEHSAFLPVGSARLLHRVSSPCVR